VVAEHGEQDVGVAAGAADESGVVAFAGGVFAVVVDPRWWVREAGGGGPEEVACCRRGVGVRRGSRFLSGG
jgi:hypothetical protein